MGYSNAKRFLATALLTAFMAPSVIAVTENELVGIPIQSPSVASMNLSGFVNLTQSEEKITLSLRDSDVKQVLRMFADKAGLNIIFHDSVKGYDYHGK